MLIAAPDLYTETFEPPTVEYQTNRDAETELTYVEYSTDLDPSDTTIETTYVFFIKRGRELRVEVDSHTMGLFAIATWGRLLTGASTPSKCTAPVGSAATFKDNSILSYRITSGCTILPHRERFCERI